MPEAAVFIFKTSLKAASASQLKRKPKQRTNYEDEEVKRSGNRPRFKLAASQEIEDNGGSFSVNANPNRLSFNINREKGSKTRRDQSAAPNEVALISTGKLREGNSARGNKGSLALHVCEPNKPELKSRALFRLLSLTTTPLERYKYNCALITILILGLIFAGSSFTSASSGCDSLDAAKCAPEPARHLKKSSYTLHNEQNQSVNRSSQHSRQQQQQRQHQQPRNKRHLGEPESVAYSLESSPHQTQQVAGSSSSKLDSVRVAAFASKLEQWFSCHRLVTNELLATLAATRSTPLNSGSSGASPEAASSHRCQANFDGHLCWPAAKAGQLIKLPCPRLNWLANVEQALTSQQRESQHSRAQEQHSLKSVINLIQLPTTTTSTVSPVQNIENNNNNNHVNPSSTGHSSETASFSAESSMSAPSSTPIGQDVNASGNLKGKFEAISS